MQSTTHGRPTVAEVSLGALRNNLREAQRLVGSRVGVMAVVKADGYGHGAVPVARALEAAGADGLGVATWDEALELRQAGLALPILVLYPVPDAFLAEAAARGIVLTLGDETLLARTLAAWTAGNPAGDRPSGRPLRVELEVETGLGRSRLERGRFVCARPAEQPWVKIPELMLCVGTVCGFVRANGLRVVVVDRHVAEHVSNLPGSNVVLLDLRHVVVPGVRRCRRARQRAGGVALLPAALDCDRGHPDLARPYHHEGSCPAGGDGARYLRSRHGRRIGGRAGLTA
jgi:hypothetical protein